MVIMNCHDTSEDKRTVGKSATYYRALKGTANMPNLCLICYSAFISSAALAQHIIGKHSDLDCFECSRCGKTGKQKNNVHNYCIKRHKEKDFEINKINTDEVERFIQKYSFKGTKVEYDKTIQSKNLEKKSKKVAKIVKCSTYSVCKIHKEDCDCDCDCDNREILVSGKNGCRYKFNSDSFSVCDTHNNKCSCSNREVFTVGLRGCVKRQNDSGNDTYSICRVHTIGLDGCACENRVVYTVGVNGCMKLFTTDTISVCRKDNSLGGCGFACINEHEYYTIGIDGCKKHTEKDDTSALRSVGAGLPDGASEVIGGRQPIRRESMGKQNKLSKGMYVFDDCWSRDTSLPKIDDDEQNKIWVVRPQSHPTTQQTQCYIAEHTQLDKLVKSVWNVSDLMRKAIAHKYEQSSSEMTPEPVLDECTAGTSYDKDTSGSDDGTAEIQDATTGDISSEIHMYDWLEKESSNIGLVMPNTIDAKIKTLLSNKLGQFIEEVKLLTSL